MLTTFSNGCSYRNNKKMSVEKPQLRLATFMCPTHPVELYELIAELLEEALGCFAVLQYESRSPGPIPNRPDPFQQNHIDIGKSTHLLIIH